MSFILFQTSVKLNSPGILCNNTVIIHTTLTLSNVLYILYCNLYSSMYTFLSLLFSFTWILSHSKTVIYENSW